MNRRIMTTNSLKYSLLLLGIVLFMAACGNKKTQQTPPKQDDEYLDVISPEGEEEEHTREIEVKKEEPKLEEEEEIVEIVPEKELEKPVESYSFLEPTVETSVVNIPVSLTISELEKMINAQFELALEQSGNFEEDGLEVQAEKLDDIKLGLEDQRIKYLVPLKLFITKDIGFTKVKADAELALQFFTEYEIKEDWTLETKSEIETYEWYKRPKLKVGGISIPAQFVGDIVIDRSKAIITQNIDDQVKNGIDLRASMEAAWKQLHEPMEVSKEYNTWMLINPEKIAMSSLENAGDAIEFTIAIDSKPSIAVGSTPKAATLKPLPPFQYASIADEDFQIFLQTDATYEQIETLALENLKGETFESGKYSATIEDMELYGQGNQLVVNTKLSGSYNGSIYMTGEPFYNKLRNKIDIRDLKYTLDTKSFLLKSASWLLKSNMRKQIRDNVNYLLDYNIEEARKQIQQQLKRYEISPGIVMKGNLADLGVTDAYLTPQGIRLNLGIKGNVNIGMETIKLQQHTGH